MLHYGPSDAFTLYYFCLFNIFEDRTVWGPPWPNSIPVWCIWIEACPMWHCSWDLQGCSDPPVTLKNHFIWVTPKSKDCFPKIGAVPSFFLGYGTVTSTILPQYFPTMGQHMGSRGESQPFYVYTITRTGAPFVNGFVNLSMSSDKYQAWIPALRTFQIKDLHPIIRWLRSDFLEFFHPEFVG